MTLNATGGSPAAAVPTEGIDPRISLASTLQSCRTTAVLLGSGMSRAAGIPTGWEVTLDLVERVARASGVDTSDDFNPEMWWRDQGRGELTYDLLVATLGLTDHDRRLMLRRYFEYDHHTGEPATPTQAHHDLAALIARGSVPVVVTTNFDQLLERALADVNITPQVLSSPTHFAGRTPLTHADFTLVKLHGDYATGQLRNAPDELATYPQGWKRLLNQIFDEYGLLVAGWSALYDRALVEAMRTTVGRRYAWYWATHQGSLEPDAQRLTTARRAHLIDIQGCDELFADLRTQVANLDQIARRGSTWRPTPVVHRIGSQRPQGWACMPCVVIRATALLGGGEDSAGLLLPDVRAAVTEALNTAAITPLLHELSARPSVSALPQQTGQPGTAEAPTLWSAPAPMVEAMHGQPIEPHQTGSDAILRCGGDGSAGVTALTEVHLRGSLGIGNQPSVTMDVGLSVAGGATVADVATIQRAALDAVVNAVIPALSAVLPEGSVALRLETSWACPGQFDSTNRPVPQDVGLNLSLLGPPSRPVTPAGGYAELVTAPFTERALARFVHRAWQSEAIHSGYLHAQQPLTALLSDPP